VSQQKCEALTKRGTCPECGFMGPLMAFPIAERPETPGGA
jgi:hypothetical protein